VSVLFRITCSILEYFIGVSWKMAKFGRYFVQFIVWERTPSIAVVLIYCAGHVGLFV